MKFPPYGDSRFSKLCHLQPERKSIETVDSDSKAFGRSPIGRALQFAIFGLVAASSPLRPANSDAAIVFAADEPLALSLGADFASQDMIRSTLFTNNDTGAIFRGNAMPLGPYYSGISYHWITFLQGLWGTSNISINVGTGTDRTNPTQSTLVLSLDRIPGQDFAILEQQDAFLGAELPEFRNAPLVRNQTVTAVGFGPQQVWGSSSVSDNGLAEAVHMRVFGVTDPTNIGLANDAGLPPDGGFINGNSTSVAYFFDQPTQAWKIAATIQTGTPIDPFTPEVLNGALDMFASGAATYINNHTPKNSTVPEPSSTALILATAAAAISRRRVKAQ